MGEVVSNESLANLLKEERRFAPPADLAANANVTAAAYEQAAADRLGFWAEQAERLSWDQETVMPRGAAEQRAEEMAAMESVLHERRTDPRIGEWLDAAVAQTPAEERTLALVARDFGRASAIPADLAAELARQTSLSHGIWAAARAADAPQDFLPTLHQIVLLKQDEANALVAAGFGGGDPYDALLDDYEPGATQAELAALFGAMRPRLVALREDVLAAPDQPRPLDSRIAQEAQLRLARACAAARSAGSPLALTAGLAAVHLGLSIALLYNAVPRLIDRRDVAAGSIASEVPAS